MRRSLVNIASHLPTHSWSGVRQRILCARLAGDVDARRFPIPEISRRLLVDAGAYAHLCRVMRPTALVSSTAIRAK